MMSGQKVGSALLELAAWDKGDWGAIIRQILLVSADVLDVARTSYWSLGETPRTLRCVLGYFALTGGFERGRAFILHEAPCYFNAVDQAGILAIEDTKADARVRELG